MTPIKVNVNDTKIDILRKIKKLSIGERFTYFSNGTLSAIDVFGALLETVGGEEITAIITTWQLGIRDSERLKKLANKYSVDLKLLLDSSYEDRNPKYFKRIKEMLGNMIWLTSNHSKIMIIESSRLHFGVLSSANFNRNFRYEFFDITESEQLCQDIKKNLECFFIGDPISKSHNKRSIIKEEFKEKFVDQEFDNTIGVDLRLPQIDFL